MKIIHTSDWHLGAKLHEQDRFEEHQAFLEALVKLVSAEQADAVIVSGDVFDIRQPGPAAQAMYYDFLAHMDECPSCRKVVVIAGNHDSASLLAASGLALRRIGVEVLAKAGEDVSREIVVIPGEDGTPGLVVAAVPFMNDGELSNFARAAGVDADTTAEKLAAGFKSHYRQVMAAAQKAASGAPVVVTGHCAVSGSAVSDARSERGRAVGGLDTVDCRAFDGADYVALGHLHIPQLMDACGAKIAYCGSPLQMSFSEAGQQKYVNAVLFGNKAGEPVDVRQCPLAATVPLRQFEGTVETIRKSLIALVGEKLPKVFVSIRVTEGEGELTPFWSEVDTIVNETGIQVLHRENARPRVNPGSGINKASERSLSAMTPIEVATLRINEESDLTDEERAVYVKMVESVVNMADSAV